MFTTLQRFALRFRKGVGPFDGCLFRVSGNIDPEALTSPSPEFPNPTILNATGIPQFRLMAEGLGLGLRARA